jgi:hypothetical protein
MQMDTKNVPNNCLDCGEVLLGRADKIYCGDSCRTHFNNQKRQANSAATPEFLKKIPKIILSNYQILKKLNTDSPTKVKRKNLETLGFNFNYQTSCYTTKKGDTYCFCFDQGYLEIKDDNVLLVQQQSQVQL